MFDSIELQDGKKFENTADLSVQFNEAVKQDFSKKNILDAIRIPEAEKNAQQRQMLHALAQIESARPFDEDMQETKAIAWMAFEEHKHVDLFVRAARRAGQSDETLAKFVPVSLATQDNAALFEKYEMRDLAAVVRTAIRPK